MVREWVGESIKDCASRPWRCKLQRSWKRHACLQNFHGHVSTAASRSNDLISGWFLSTSNHSDIIQMANRRRQTGLFLNFNRNAIGSYNLASRNNLWTGKAMVLQAWASNVGNGFGPCKPIVKYASGKSHLELGNMEYVSESYTAEVGYVPRRGILQNQPKWRLTLFPKSEKNN